MKAMEFGIGTTNIIALGAMSFTRNVVPLPKIYYNSDSEPDSKNYICFDCSSNTK